MASGRHVFIRHMIVRWSGQQLELGSKLLVLRCSGCSAITERPQIAVGVEEGGPAEGGSDQTLQASSLCPALAGSSGLGVSVLVWKADPTSHVPHLPVLSLDSGLVRGSMSEQGYNGRPCVFCTQPSFWEARSPREGPS